MKARPEKARGAFACAALLVALAVLNSCGGISGSFGPPRPEGRPQSVSASSPAKPARIISLTPSTTEILHGVGAFDREYYENGFRTPGINGRAGAALSF